MGWICIRDRHALEARERSFLCSECGRSYTQTDGIAVLTADERATENVSRSLGELDELWDLMHRHPVERAIDRFCDRHEIGKSPHSVDWRLFFAVPAGGHVVEIGAGLGMAIVHGHPSQKPTRGYSAGLINLRPDRDGHIVGYDGLELIDQLGSAVIDYYLPPVGSRCPRTSSRTGPSCWKPGS